jgi:addiction module HigA family antidote
MDVKRTAEFAPDYAIQPGETVLEVLESLGLSQAELAERTGRPKKTINEIVNGKAAITPETALQLERVLGVPAAFWNSLEQNYRAGLARQAERERLEQQTGWLKEIPVKDLVKEKWVELKSRPADQVEAALSFFGVASVDAWRNVWGGLRSEVAFRQSAAFESAFGAVASWLRIGEIEARSMECALYDTARFRTVLVEARALTRESPEVFCSALVERCASAGVVVCFVKELPRSRVCGATRWLNPTKALIQLSLRYRTNDHLWFTFFHEAGHILLHGKRAVFIEEAGGGQRPQAAVREESDSNQPAAEEEEANRFAGEFLIPPARFARFIQDRDFSAAAIRQFADEIGIAPGIVVGQLQHAGTLPYQTPLNHLKQRYSWAQ